MQASFGQYLSFECLGIVLKRCSTHSVYHYLQASKILSSLCCRVHRTVINDFLIDCFTIAWGFLSWAGFASLSLSLTLCCTHTHTHTHTHTCIQTHTPALSPTCLSSQSALALLCSDTCSHSSNHSLYLKQLCLLFSVGLLCVMHLMWSPHLSNTLEISSCLAWNCCELLVISVSCCCLQWAQSHELPQDWSPLDQTFYIFVLCVFQFCVYVRQTALFCSFIKDCLY